MIVVTRVCDQDAIDGADRLVGSDHASLRALKDYVLRHIPGPATIRCYYAILHTGHAGFTVAIDVPSQTAEATERERRRPDWSSPEGAARLLRQQRTVTGQLREEMAVRSATLVDVADVAKVLASPTVVADSATTAVPCPRCAQRDADDLEKVRDL